MTITASIPIGNLDPLRRRVTRLATRAEACGMPPVSMTVERIHDETREIPDRLGWIRGEADAKRTVVSRIVAVRVEGGLPWSDRWKVVGSRLRVRTSDGRTGLYNTGRVPSEIAMRAIRCEHCDASRRRVRSFVVERIEDGFAREVGGDCLGDFLGVAAGSRLMEGIGVTSSIIAEIVAAQDPYWRHGGPDEILEEALLVMAIANRIVQEDGWISGSTARETGRPSTWRKVAATLETSRRDGVEMLSSHVPLGGDFVAAEDAVRWLSGRNDDAFLADAAAVVERGLAGRKEVAILSAAMAAYRRHLVDEDARRRVRSLAERSVHIGEVGERLERTVAVRGIRRIENRFGAASVIMMHDAAGNLLSWLTGRNPGLAVGHCYEIRGTIKEHVTMEKGDTPGAAETRIARVAIVADLGPGDLAPPVSKDGLSAEDAAVIDALPSSGFGF